MASNYIPQVDYTSRDYAAIRDNMIALIPSLLPEWTTTDASDFGITLIELFAYMGDMLNYYIDRAANEGFIGTATQRSSVLSLAQLLGYSPSTATPATVMLTFTNKTTSAVTIPAGTQVATTTTVNGVSTQVIFETNFSASVAANSSANVQATEGKTIQYEYLGDSDGTANQSKSLSKSPLLANTSSIIVGTLVGGVPVGVAYTEIPYIIDAGSNDPSYSVTTDANNISYINFGDGISGRIPPANGIYATYRIGGGVLGNVGPGSLTYPLTALPAGITVTNLSAATGGADQESTDSIRINAPLAYTAMTRAVSLLDYASLAVQTPAVAKAMADSGSAYNNVTLYIAPFGDSALNTPGVDLYGNTTPTFTSATTNLISYLTDKAPATASITINPPKYVPINVTLTAYLNPQYRQSVVTTAINSALASAFTFDNVIFSENIVLQYLHTILSKVDGVDYVNINLLTRADGLFTGNLTSGSPTITNPSSVLNVSVGQQVALSIGSGGNVTIPSGTTISAINTATSTITAASVTGGIITFTGNNSFVAGQPVTITGVTPAAFNISGVIGASPTSTSFTVVNSSVTGTYVSGGVATAVVSYTMSANAGGTGSASAAGMWTSSLATTGVNNIQLAVNELPKNGAFTVVTSGGINS
jgi:hypothetical protein